MAPARRTKAGIWIRIWVVILFPLTSAFFRMRWRHLERIPATGPVLIAANHLSHADTVLLARLVWSAGRIPRFMIKSEVFSWPVIGVLMSRAGQIPVSRGNSDASRALEQAGAALERGEAVIIYPEGTTTRDPDNWPMRAKTGVARLALLAPDVPVVAVGQWGPHRMGGPSLRRLARRRNYLASVAEPLRFGQVRDVPPTPAVLRQITDDVMRAVRDEVAELRGETAPAEFSRL